MTIDLRDLRAGRCETIRGRFYAQTFLARVDLTRDWGVPTVSRDRL